MSFDARGNTRTACKVYLGAIENCNGLQLLNSITKQRDNRGRKIGSTRRYFAYGKIPVPRAGHQGKKDLHRAQDVSMKQRKAMRKFGYFEMLLALGGRIDVDKMHEGCKNRQRIKDKTIKLGQMGMIYSQEALYLRTTKSAGRHNRHTDCGPTGKIRQVALLPL